MPSPEERQAKALERIASELPAVVKVLTALNDNVAKTGSLFKAWLETPEVESVLDTDEFIKGYQSQEVPEPKIGEKFVVTDSSSDFFNMRGEIVEVYENSSVLVKFNSVVDLVPFFLNQICILTEPDAVPPPTNPLREVGIDFSEMERNTRSSRAEAGLLYDSEGD